MLKLNCDKPKDGAEEKPQRAAPLQEILAQVANPTLMLHLIKAFFKCIINSKDHISSSDRKLLIGFNEKSVGIFWRLDPVEIAPGVVVTVSALELALILNKWAIAKELLAIMSYHLQSNESSETAIAGLHAHFNEQEISLITQKIIPVEIKKLLVRTILAPDQEGNNFFHRIYTACRLDITRFDLPEDLHPYVEIFVATLLREVRIQNIPNPLNVYNKKMDLPVRSVLRAGVLSFYSELYLKYMLEDLSYHLISAENQETPREGTTSEAQFARELCLILYNVCTLATRQVALQRQIKAAFDLYFDYLMHLKPLVSSQDPSINNDLEICYALSVDEIFLHFLIAAVLNPVLYDSHKQSPGIFKHSPLLIEHICQEMKPKCSATVILRYHRTLESQCLFSKFLHGKIPSFKAKRTTKGKHWLLADPEIQTVLAISADELSYFEVSILTYAILELLRFYPPFYTEPQAVETGLREECMKILYKNLVETTTRDMHQLNLQTFFALILVLASGSYEKLEEINSCLAQALHQHINDFGLEVLPIFYYLAHVMDYSSLCDKLCAAIIEHIEKPRLILDEQFAKFINTIFKYAIKFSDHELTERIINFLGNHNSLLNQASINLIRTHIAEFIVKVLREDLSVIVTKQTFVMHRQFSKLLTGTDASPHEVIIGAAASAELKPEFPSRMHIENIMFILQRVYGLVAMQQAFGEKWKKSFQPITRKIAAIEVNKEAHSDEIYLRLIFDKSISSHESAKHTGTKLATLIVACFGLNCEIHLSKDNDHFVVEFKNLRTHDCQHSIASLAIFEHQVETPKTQPTTARSSAVEIEPSPLTDIERRKSKAREERKKNKLKWKHSEEEQKDDNTDEKLVMPLTPSTSQEAIKQCSIQTQAPHQIGVRYFSLFEWLTSKELKLFSLSEVEEAGGITLTAMPKFKR